MPPTVVLEHRLSDHDFHFDWLIDRDGRSPLLTFRIPPPSLVQGAPGARLPGCPLLSIAPPASFTAERIADHRRLYLDYEGPISGGRGEVRRIAAGDAEIVTETGESLEVRIRFPGLEERLWRGQRADHPPDEGTARPDPEPRAAPATAGLWTFSL